MQFSPYLFYEGKEHRLRMIDGLDSHESLIIGDTSHILEFRRINHLSPNIRIEASGYIYSNKAILLIRNIKYFISINLTRWLRD